MRSFFKGFLGLAWLGLLFGACGSPGLPYSVQELARDATDSRIEGDYVAYEKGQDIYLYRASTGANWTVTHDGSFVRDKLLGMVAGVVWFSSSLGSGPLVLRAYEIERGRLRDLLQGSQKIQWGGAYGNQAILNIDEAWWLCTPESQQKVTPDAEAYTKYECAYNPDGLVWSGRRPAMSPYQLMFKTFFLVPVTLPIRQEDRNYGYLCGSDTEVAWVAGPRTGENLVEIELLTFNPWQSVIVETFGDSRWEDVLDVDPGELVYVRTSGSESVFSLIHYAIGSGAKSCLYVSSVRKVRPLLEGNWIAYVSQNCPDGSCEELCVFDRSRRTSCRLTTLGAGHRIVRVDLDGDRLVWTDLAPQTGQRVLMAVLGSS